MKKGKLVLDGCDLKSLPGRFRESDIKDLQALKAIKSGNSIGFDYLYNKYRDYIRYYCYMKLRDQKTSEDLANEILIRVYNNLDKYEMKYTLSSWIYRITKNYVIDHVRKQKKNLTNMSRSVSIQEVSVTDNKDEQALGIISSEVIASNFLSPEERYTKRELRRTRIEILKEYLGQINEQDRNILLMYYYEDMSYDEIASKLNIGLSKMKVRMLRAKKKLKEMMTGLEPIVDII